MATKIIDVSTWQGNIDWSEVKADGVQGLTNPPVADIQPVQDVCHILPALERERGRARHGGRRARTRRAWKAWEGNGGIFWP